MRTPIVLLNGSPSAGKTTLARALHARMSEPVFYLSLDEFRQGVDRRFWSTEHIPGLFSAMVRAHLRALAAVADEGVPVITETIILPGTRPHYMPLFETHDVTLVGVRCPLPVAQAREAARTDRLREGVELDVPDFTLVHDQAYDVEVDTSSESTEESVRRILAKLDWAGSGEP